MGILQKMLENPATFVVENKKSTQKSSTRSKGGGNSADATLYNDAEVERLSQYISDEEMKKIINEKTALEHGVEAIGTKNDYEHVTSRLLETASDSAKRHAASVILKLATDDINIERVLPSGKKIIGLPVSKNIYLKKVNYIRNGKNITFIGAWSGKDGTRVKIKTALKLQKRFEKNL